MRRDGFYGEGKRSAERIRLIDAAGVKKAALSILAFLANISTGKIVSRSSYWTTFQPGEGALMHVKPVLQNCEITETRLN